MHVPTCYPGIVQVQGEEYDPDPKKWEGVSTVGGKVEVDIRFARTYKPTFMDKGKRWKPVDKSIYKELRNFQKKRFTHGLYGIGCSGARPMVSAAGPHNSAKALFGRAFRCAKEAPWGSGPKHGTWKKAAEFIPLLLPDLIPQGRMTNEEWIDTMPKHRQRPLRKAAENYERTGYLKVYEEFQAFVKTELLPAFAKNRELTRLTSMMDRMIQGPADEAHVMMGPWLKPLLKKLKSNWTPDSAIFYGSCGPEGLHKFMREHLVDGAHQFFWCDFSMYDNTHSVDSWEFMAEIYRRAGITDKDFWRMFKAWMAPRGKMGPFRYQARVMNASGRDDTALANGVLNGFATYLSVTAAWFGVSLCDVTLEQVREMRSIVRLSVCGDDSIGALPPVSEERMADLRKRIAENIREFGFEAKLNSSMKLSDAVYLGMRPYPTKDGWFWGKTIGRATYKMGWSLLSHQKDMMARMTGIADMHVLCSSHVPVLSDLARKIVELRDGAKRTPVVRDPNREWEWTYQSNVVYDDITLQYVADTYTTRAVPGNPLDNETVVSKEDVVGLIEAIRDIKALPCMLDHWLWKHMILIDDL